MYQFNLSRAFVQCVNSGVELVQTGCIGNKEDCTRGHSARAGEKLWGSPPCDKKTILFPGVPTGRNNALDIMGDVLVLFRLG